uniref:ATP-dependent RNA helicase n=1 Tax=Aceria tosichella TaxID=561515 RepID=A0A6G1SJY3_9ACAR
MAAFAELGVMPEIVQALEKMDWLLPTEIQAEAIPLILGGGDILMASETGTGKTGAFCVPIVQVVYEQIHMSPDQKSADKPAGPAKQSAPDVTALSIDDRDPGLVLSSDMSTAKSKSGQWQGCRANKGIRRSRGAKNSIAYYEVYFLEPGLARVGWSFANARLELGTDRDGWGYGGTAKKSNNKQFLDYGETFGEKWDSIGCLLNLESGDISFTKNRHNLGVAFKIPLDKLERQTLYPTICVKNACCQVLFGHSADYYCNKPDWCVWLNEMGKNLELNPTNRASNTSLNARAAGPLAIILEPSRELAKQTYDCLETFSSGLDIVTELLVGGSNDKKQAGDKTHIVVCTPGRLSEAVSKNQLPLSNVHFFILDEADGLLQQGLENLIRSIASKLPMMFGSGRRMQTICCSATLHNFQVKKLAQDLMYFPTWIDLKGEDSVPDTVHHVVFRVDPLKDTTYTELNGLFCTDGVHANDNVTDALFAGSKRTPAKPEALSEAIKLMKFYYTLRAIENLKMDQGIIFCRTKLDCDNLYDFMQNMNKKTRTDKYACVRLHSSLSQQERTDNLEYFKRGKTKFLICTDVAARGIDVRGVPFVIQVTLPDEKANYVHRIGRVGRADRMGLAVSLVGTVPEKVWYHGCRRRECHDTRLTEAGGCCKWFDELAMLADIEEHLKCSIQEIDRDFKLQVDEFDGKVVYGAKRLEQSSTYEGHVEQLKTIVSHLTELESRAQKNFISLYL